MNECDKDSCPIDFKSILAYNGKKEPDKLEPMDYDAPGSTVREQGV